MGGVHFGGCMMVTSSVFSFRDIWFCSQEDGKYQDVRKRTW